MTAQELIDKLQTLPGDKELRPVLFARQKRIIRGLSPEWVTYAILGVRLEPMAIWLVGEEAP